MHVDGFHVVKIDIFEDLEQFVLVDWFEGVEGFFLWNHTAEETVLNNSLHSCFHAVISRFQAFFVLYGCRMTIHHKE